MKAEYKNILVRFRKDEPGHMAAWNYIHDMISRKKTSADVIAELVEQKVRDGVIAPVSDEQIFSTLSDVQRLCKNMDEKISRVALSPAAVSDGVISTEKDQSEEEIETGILDFALDMGD